MDKDTANLKKWLITMGMDVNDCTDEVVKKLIPPQRRDMWRNIIKHVKPAEEVNLIKKSLLLHKLIKRKKPLMAKVEDEDDLLNALVYEDLLTHYMKIEKEIVDIKTKNYEVQKNIKTISANTNKVALINTFNFINSYLAEQKTGYYAKFYRLVRELTELSEHFAAEANNNLIKTDYEDSLIKCCAVVDNAKQVGKMNDSVYLGKDLCNKFYETLREKSPAILIETIEENLKIHISESYKILNSVCIEKDEQCNNIDREVLFEQFFKELLQKQLDFKTILSKTESEKYRLENQLVDNSQLIKNDIISQFKLQNVSHTEEQLSALKVNISEAFENVIKNCLDCSNVIGLPEKPNIEDDTFKTLDSIFDETTKLNDKIEQKRLKACAVLTELHKISYDFGLPEISTEIEKIVEDYSKKVLNMDEVNKLMISMKHIARTDKNNVQNSTFGKAIKQGAHKYRTLEEIAYHIESLDVFAVLRKQFEELDKTIFDKNNFTEIKKKERTQIAEFKAFMSQMKNQLSELNISVEDCKLVADIESNKKSEK